MSPKPIKPVATAEHIEADKLTRKTNRKSTKDAKLVQHYLGAFITRMLPYTIPDSNDTEEQLEIKQKHDTDTRRKND